MNTNLTLKQLQFFLEVAEQKSFTRAAERFHLAQPALSKAIRSLESQLDIRLFDRTTRRVELTDAGKEFQLFAQKLASDLDSAVNRARDLSLLLRGFLVIAAPPLLSASILPPSIASYRKRSPGIKIKLIDAGTDEIVRKVREREAECGVGTFAPGEDGIQSTFLAKDCLMLFCAKDSALAHRDQIAWKDLTGQKLIALTRESSIRLLTDKTLMEASVQSEIEFEVSHISTAIMLVKAGLGVSVLPSSSWAFANDKAVVFKPLIGPVVWRDISMIQASGRPLSPAAKAFIPHIRKYARLSISNEEFSQR